jgi:hypothetical protein
MLTTEIHLSKAFRNGAFPLSEASKSTAQYLDYSGLLQKIEELLGCSGYSTNTEYLRVELYRQALQEWLETHPDAFFSASYRVDRFATATALLNHRDTLKFAGFPFEKLKEGESERLVVFCSVEERFRKKITHVQNHQLAFGEADRFRQVMVFLNNRTTEIPLQTLWIHDPKDLVPVHIRELAQALADRGVLVEWCDQPPATATPGTDLATFIEKLQKPGLKSETKPKADGSIILFKPAHDLTAARWIAQWLRLQNQSEKPTIIAATGQSVLAQSLQAEGLSSTGVINTSVARPALQVIKLAPCFLWQPFDVYKVMEFVNLPVNPLDDELTRIISQTLAEKPGFDSELWFARVQSFLDSAAPEVTESYRFLFKRNRYDSETSVPRHEVIELYTWIADWAGKQSGLDANLEHQVLAAQSRRICELLKALPDARLSFLEVEHIIRTVFEPVPIEIVPDTIQPYEMSTEPGAILYPTRQLIWWNCVDLSAPPKPDFWTSAERDLFAVLDVHPDSPAIAHKLDKYLQIRPLYQVKDRLILFMPNQIAGEPTQIHPLLNLLEASFKDVHSLVQNIATVPAADILEKYENLPKWQAIEANQTPPPQPFITTTDALIVHEEGREESFTQLQNLLYYPHLWYMQKHLRFQTARILDIKSDVTLLGNLAHRFFEELLPHADLLKMSRTDLNNWMDGITQRILEEEGATLLLYGREIEKQQFLHKLRRSLFVFVQMLQNNGWEVRQVEHSFTGKVLDIPVRCRTDVILQRGADLAILDLKWAGTNKRADQIRNGEDIQLITYARGLEPLEYWPHTGFYIISDAKLIMRNRDAFDNAMIPGKQGETSYQEKAVEIFNHMEATLAWRLEQLRNGQIEVRTTDTFQELEDIYGSALVDLLNLPQESGKYDPYLTLIYGQ